MLDGRSRPPSSLDIQNTVNLLMDALLCQEQLHILEFTNTQYQPVLILARYHAATIGWWCDIVQKLIISLCSVLYKSDWTIWPTKAKVQLKGLMHSKGNWCTHTSP